MMILWIWPVWNKFPIAYTQVKWDLRWIIWPEMIRPVSSHRVLSRFWSLVWSSLTCSSLSIYKNYPDSTSHHRIVFPLRICNIIFEIIRLWNELSRRSFPSTLDLLSMWILSLRSLSQEIPDFSIGYKDRIDLANPGLVISAPLPKVLKSSEALLSC